MNRPEMGAGPYAAARAAMVDSLRPWIKDERVLSAFARVPRERFVIPELRARAYDDTPLPIGFGQTISQPAVVAIMLELLALQGGERVLDIGTGSGYQAALLSLLAREVVSVELIPELAARAAETLQELGYTNVSVHVAGETLGRQEDAPYDAIVVAAAAPRVPDDLVQQLGPGGRMVLPVGSREGQELRLVERSDGGVSTRNAGACRFVPLLGRGAFADGERHRWR